MMRDEIDGLKDLIEEYDDAHKDLENMVSRWRNQDDPCSDPGLQYEQELLVERKYKNIIEYTKKMYNAGQ